MEGLVLTTKEQLQAFIAESVSIEFSKHAQLLNNSPIAPAKESDTLRTRKETAEKLRVTLATLHQYTLLGKIVANRIGNRVLYKDSDIQAALSQIKTGNKL